MAIPISSKKTYQISTGYIISMIIGEYEYEPDITNIQIITSLNSAYPIYIIQLNLRPIEVLQHKIFGQNSIFLKIIHADHNKSQMDEEYNVKLLYLSGDFDIPNSNQLLSNMDSLQDLVPYTMRCIPETAFEFMTQNVNFIFRNSTIKNIYYYISNYCKSRMINTNLSIEYDHSSPYINNKPIPQIILPPTIIKNHFDYLLNEFGLYYTWGAIFASISEYKTGDIIINALDIGYQYEKGTAIFTIKQLANDVKTDDISRIETYGYDNFYIYTPINTKYIANTTIGNIGNDIQYIHKPVDKFVRLDDEILMNDLSSISASVPEFMNMLDHQPFISPVLENRKKYVIDHICHYKNQTDPDEYQDRAWLISNINKNIMNFSQLECKLEKHLPIFRFTDIGKMVLFESETSEYKPYNGKYILFSSVMNFNRSKTWEMTVNVKLIRPTWSLAKDD